MPLFEARFEAAPSGKAGTAARHIVIDNANAIEVFHWWGPTAREKCEAVAKALNDLNHGLN